MKSKMDVSENCLTLHSIPEKIKIHSMELDLTWDCNLGCVYCYKGERHEVAISKRIAFDAVTWLFHASALSKNISLFFMGGEPLLQFELIKKLVPYARRRSMQQDKNLTISMTTNCTLVTDEVLDFYKKWDVGFHTSIDGVPDVQNNNRPFGNGEETASVVSSVIPAILQYRPGTTARATVIPENVDFLSANYLYFRGLGYTSIAMIPSDVTRWCNAAFEKYEQQLRCVAELWKNDIRQGIDVFVSFCPSNFQGRKLLQRPSIPCGAGRGLVSVDVFGNIWPCNRWNAHGHSYWGQWFLGNIYSEFYEEARRYFIEGNPPTQECKDCLGRFFCGGGCHASNIDSTGNIKQQHENACQLSRIQAGIALDLYDELYAEKCPIFMKHHFPDEFRKISDSAILATEKDKGYDS